ncbi:NADH-quinone oxidoreductase subunit J [Opitutales bacterium ASA1]|uniref:NADH-quinone oxidoreductase subunit J family protein n=1 Tax=Congregicoccus parvus TaxID=3081749 RepID=UPI002B31292A|nr:NADH-quinone oxidoreductase subunit J [Opitutales bacterium ASA1]
MQDVFFYIFSAVTLAGALLVVTKRNAVDGAMFMILSFLGMAALFVLLEAYFLAVIQVLVYAGAVVVLFLFIIMLLDVQAAARVKAKLLTRLAALVSVSLLFVGTFWAVRAGALPEPEALGPAPASSLKAFGYSLFTTYLLPMQVTGFLLLVAMIGVIVLSKRFEQPGAGPKAAAANPKDA